MLSLAIEYLTGRSVSSVYDFDTAEWPPHPARFFYALVAAFHSVENPDAEERDALCWLEKQRPPEILASERTEGSVPIVYVPVNTERSGGSSISPDIPIPRGRQGRTFPSVLPRSPVVYFLWRDAQPSDGCLKALSRLSGRVSYLGHSSSLVALRFGATEAEGVGLDRYAPMADGDLMLRLPREGLLVELEELYRSRGEEKVELPYEPVSYGRKGVDHMVARQPPRPGPFGSIIVFRSASNPAPSITAVFNVASAFRGALIQKNSGDGPMLPEVISGHLQDGSVSSRTHLAIVGLPDVGHPHADGSLKGLGVLLPTGLPEEEGERVLRAIGMLGRLVQLKMGEHGVWSLERDPVGGGLMALDPATWIGPARRWATVTPVVLDRFPRRAYSDESASTISDSCVRMGLPAPEQVEVGPVSAFEGAPPVSEFVPYRKQGMPPRIHVHAFISFGDEVQGPLLVGAGRYMGMGLFRPMR